MMKPETVLRIFQAAEDWLQGYTTKDLMAKYNRKARVIHYWKNTHVWQSTVAGRVRQKKKNFATYDRHQDIHKIQYAAQRWVTLGKPSAGELAEDMNIPEKEIEKWMEMPFWEATTVYTEHHIKRNKEKKKSLRKVGPRFPMHLLKQAVFWHLAGYSFRKIGPFIGRTEGCIRHWQSTEAWYDMKDEIMKDKLMMFMLNRGLTIQDMYRKICESQGLDSPTAEL